MIKFNISSRHHHRVRSVFNCRAHTKKTRIYISKLFSFKTTFKCTHSSVTANICVIFFLSYYSIVFLWNLKLCGCKICCWPSHSVSVFPCSKCGVLSCKFCIIFYLFGVVFHAHENDDDDLYLTNWLLVVFL